MFIIIIGIIFFAAGTILFLFTGIFPILRLVYFDWIALIIMCIPYILVLFRLHSSRCWKQADRNPKWKHLIKYLRRDNETIEVLGERAYPGESFVDIPLLGLIEYLGKDCYYTSGDKKYAWVLENMNFTPDPRYSNLTHILWSLGFGNSEEVKAVLTGVEGTDGLRDKVYKNMGEWDDNHGVNKLNKELEGYDGKVIDFKPSIVKHNKIGEMVDKLSHIKRRGGGN